MTTDQMQVKITVPGFTGRLFRLETYKKIVLPPKNKKDEKIRCNVGFTLGFFACSVILPLQCKEMNFEAFLITTVLSLCSGYVGAFCLKNPVIPIMLTPMFISAFFIRNRI